MEKRGKVEYDDTDLPRSFILTDEDGEVKVRLSRISTQGLKIRLGESFTEIKK